MSELDCLKKYNIQNKIDQLAGQYRGKQVVLFPAGDFCADILQNYDLSGLNIIGIADERFEQEKTDDFFGLKRIMLNDMQTLDYDLILVADSDYKNFVTILDEQILYGTKNAAVEIRPLISLSFWDIYRMG